MTFRYGDATVQNRMQLESCFVPNYALKRYRPYMNIISMIVTMSTPKNKW